MLHGLTLLFAVIAGILLAAVPSLLWLTLWMAGKIAHFNVPFAPFGWTAVGIVAAAWLILAYGFFVGRFRLETKAFPFTHQDVPSDFNHYKIVQISDLHLSTFNDRPSALQRIVDSINAQEPDLICFTGDLVTTGVAEALPYTDILKQLHAKDGIASVFGNHDFLIYNHQFTSKADRAAEVARLENYEREVLGWHLLRNEHLVIEKDSKSDNRRSSITIMGVDNCSCANEGFPTLYAGDLSKAMKGTSGFRMLLTHDPGHWRAEAVGRPIALTLSGHTHSGQVRMFGKALSDISFKESAGWFRTGGQALYINSGIGCTLPIRLNCPAEITVITLLSTK